MSRNYRWIVTDPGVWQKVLPELMAAGRQTQELQDMVVITSLAETALDCRRLGIFCVGYDPDRSGLYFPGVSLVTEDPEACHTPGSSGCAVLLPEAETKTRSLAMW